MSRRRTITLAMMALVTALGGTQACMPLDDAPEGTSLQLAELLGGTDTMHARAVEPRVFEFPADHGEHPGFRTEWWYFTGALTASDGTPVGYQLTFFRSALVDSATYLAGVPDSASTSDWRTRHAYMAHFAVSDGGSTTFHASERFARAAVGLAGAQANPFRVWLGDWHARTLTPTRRSDSLFPLTLHASDAGVAIDLVLGAGKPIVLQGERGLSRKGAQPGNASYYYSLTRMPTTGTITTGGRTLEVNGDSWLDREWSTSVLADGIAGWDWFALQLNDSTELMLYRLRREDGTADEFSAGMFVDAEGQTRPLASTDFRLTPVRTWSSRRYPTAWRLEVPAIDLELSVEAVFDAQELTLAVRYWEGMVNARGTRAGTAISGRGYLEMTGYDENAERE